MRVFADTSVTEWHPSECQQLVEVYNAQAAEIPYEYPVDPETFVEAYSRPDPNFADGRLFACQEHGTPLGLVHVGTIPREDGRDERTGLIRHLCFPRNRRDVGGKLLECAHEYLRPLASTGQAFNYGYGYACTWYNHLKSPWEHIYALLGTSGYVVDGGWALIMVLRDYEMSEPALPDTSIDVEVSEDPIFPGLTTHGDIPTVAVRLFRSGERIGGNEARPYYLPHWDRALQDTCCTMGMGVNEAERGRGLGRYLMERTLYEMQGHGCRHALLDVDSQNYRALTLYASMGYRTCYQVCQMTRADSATAGRQDG